MRVVKRTLLANVPISQYKLLTIYREPDASITIETYDSFDNVLEVERIDYDDENFWKKLAKIFCRHPQLLYDMFLRHPINS